jgi:3',5'-cyclic AMP phosphodiesterase CpdA
MRTLVHISDIHFGKADYAVAARVREKINELAPDLMII